jgi:hypothetical protein
MIPNSLPDSLEKIDVSSGSGLNSGSYPIVIMRWRQK